MGRRVTQVAGAAFDPNTPKNIASNLVWWDASQITGQLDNTALSTWAVANGNTNLNFAQSGTFRPTYYSSTAGKTVNGHPAVWFSGAQVMQPATNTGAHTQPWTYYVIGGVTATTGTQVFADDFTGTTHNLLEVTGGSWTASAGTTLTGGAAATGVHLFVFVANGATSSLVVDNVATNGAAGANSLTPFTIGANSGGTSNLTGFICEAGVYTNAMSGANQTLLHTYAHGKWGTP